MENIILENYLISLTDDTFLLEGISPSLVKDAIQDIRKKDVKSFLKKYKNKIKGNVKQLEKEVDKAADKAGIKKENVTTSKVMLKRALGTIFVGVSATILIPITLACLLACIIRSIKNKESILDNVVAIIKEIKSGIKTTRRTNVTSMEKAIITAGQAAEYLWGVLSSDPMVAIKNFIAFFGMFIAAIFYFWKGIVFAGEKTSTDSKE